MTDEPFGVRVWRRRSGSGVGMASHTAVFIVYIDETARQQYPAVYSIQLYLFNTVDR